VIDPRSLPSAVALESVLQAGREALAQGQVANALRTFDEALRIKPTYAPAWRAKGRALRFAGDPKAALDCYAEALRYEPADEGAWFGLALALHEMGRRDEELEAYDELLRRNPRNVAAWMNRGVALHEEGRYEDALACYERILAMRPEVAPAWNDRGAALLRLGRLDEALISFDEALALDPALEDASANRAEAARRLERSTSLPPAIALPLATLPPSAQLRVLSNLALARVDAWRAMKPQGTDDFLALGSALLDEGLPEGAGAAFGKAAAMGGGVAAALGGLLSLTVRNDPGVLDEAGRILAAYGDLPRVAIAIASIRESRGDLEGALTAIDGATSRGDDGIGWLWNWRGRLFLALGRAEDARVAFEGATARDPDDEEAWTNFAASLHLVGRPEEALAACDRAIALGHSAAARNNRGVILASMDRGAEAERLFRRAESRHAVALLNRARLAEDRRQFRDARRLYDSCLAVMPGDAEAVVGRRRVLGHLGAQGRETRRRMLARFASVPGIGPSAATRIWDAGFDSAAKVRRARAAELQESAKISKAQARALKSSFSV
jgi:tetratricopeptide (TPR) repeat protein